jgi:hypothetical protein
MSSSQIQMTWFAPRSAAPSMEVRQEVASACRALRKRSIFPTRKSPWSDRTTKPQAQVPAVSTKANSSVLIDFIIVLLTLHPKQASCYQRQIDTSYSIAEVKRS